MRVKLGKHIFLCTVATHPDNSNLLILTTPNGVYTVNVIVNYYAEYIFKNLLEKGYCDLSDYEYSN